jgi:host factor-I protein
MASRGDPRNSPGQIRILARPFGLQELTKMNRRLIRPSLSDVQDQMGARMQRKKPAPPDQTNAENFYYVKQMQGRTQMVIILDQGETIHGVIEWYDRNCIKVHRTNEPNLLIMKSCIRYMYKEGENRNGSNHEGDNHHEIEMDQDE